MDKQALYLYRLKQAQEPLDDATNMLKGDFTTRSVVNRAYYAVFYATLALFVKEKLDIKTSKHSGIISVFDKDFVHTGRLDIKYSKILHRLFDARQESDYRELVDISHGESSELVDQAKDFLTAINTLLKLSD